jgi:hypothetical protein
MARTAIHRHPPPPDMWRYQCRYRLASPWATTGLGWRRPTVCQLESQGSTETTVADESKAAANRFEIEFSGRLTAWDTLSRSRHILY